MNHIRFEVLPSRSVLPEKRAFGLGLCSLIFALYLIWAPPAGAQTTYTQAATTFSFQDISATGTPVSLSDDQVSSAVPIGFNFRFYNTIYTQLFISDNGFVTFLAGQDDGCCDGQPLPTAGDPDGLIAGFWDDLITEGAAGGTDGLFYQTVGVPGSRVFIVMFKNVPNCCNVPGPADYTFEIKLFEGSNNIEVHYLNVNNDGNVGSAGVENEMGTVGTQFFLGTGNIASSTAVRYTLSAPTAADVVIAGRVVTNDGRGIKNVNVTLLGGDLTQPRTALTGPFGYYRFEDLEVGESYVITIRSKRYRFDENSVLVTPGDSVFDLNFVALP